MIDNASSNATQYTIINMQNFYFIRTPVPESALFAREGTKLQ